MKWTVDKAETYLDEKTVLIKVEKQMAKATLSNVEAMKEELLKKNIDLYKKTKVATGFARKVNELNDEKEMLVSQVVAEKQKNQELEAIIADLRKQLEIKNAKIGKCEQRAAKACSIAREYREKNKELKKEMKISKKKIE